MSLSVGERVGPYEILGLLGAGGMGEVYHARDTRLKRDAAIKVLPDAFARDPDRVARFQREAELLATLSHPNIAAVYGLEEASTEVGRSRHALVLELVEGPTLADRTAAGPLPVDEATNIARQIADALVAAHARGVIHRDLKPANIKLTSGGKVKVLDFGLAKMLETEQHDSSMTMSPTLSVHATSAGVILGTAAYMSPEQARGKPVDQRSDIWSFGCVFYEMLTGRPVFAGADTVSDAVAAILTRDPDWSALPPQVPQRIRTLLRRCLQRDPDRRLHHIADARLELDEPAEPTPTIAPPGRVTPLWVRSAPWALALAALGIAAWAVWQRPGGASTGAPSVLRLELNLPAGVEMFAGATRPIAISPDGSRIAFIGVVAGSRMVYLRSMDQFESSPVKGSENATVCFFSPDGRAIGLVTASGVLKTISLVDGLVLTLTDDVSFLNGGTWSADGTIVFSRGGVLWQIPQSGGTAKAITTLGGAQQDTLHAWPNALPDGHAILFSATSGDRTRIDALVLATGERKAVVDQGTLPLTTAVGHLVFFRNREVLAAPFDADRLEVTGPSLRAIENLPGSATGTPAVDVSRSGTVIYAPTTAVSQMVWVTRQGIETPLNDELRGYANPRLSPDGSRLVVQAGDFWIQDLSRSTFTRLTSRSTTSNGFPEWTPDGRRVVFRTANGLRLQDADGGGQTVAIPNTSEFDYPSSFADNGQTLIFMRSTQQTSFDVFSLPLRDPSQMKPLVKTTAYESGARLSPDGRWLLYISNDSGQNEVYLRPYGGADRRWQVSTQGGTQALWNANGKEIFYRVGNKMMAVNVTTAPEVVLSRPQQLFEQRYAFGAGITIANYDVARDGQRFIMVKDEAAAGRLNVVINWLSDLSRLSAATTP